MMPPVRVAMASPVAKPVKTVADHAGSTLRVITRIASVAHVIAAAKGTSMGVKNKLPLDAFGWYLEQDVFVTLLFYAFAMIVQFGALMWFMSRPRTYTVTPDNAQIGLPEVSARSILRGSGPATAARPIRGKTASESREAGRDARRRNLPAAQSRSCRGTRG